MKDGLRLRLAKPEDVTLLFSWRNDGETRYQSRHTGPVGWNEHKAWFEQALSSPDCVIVLAENEREESIGTVRADILANGVAEISYTIAPEFRGRGLSKLMVQKFADEYLAGKKIVAHIKKGHAPSESVARSLGLAPFSEKEPDDFADPRPMVEWR